MDVAPASPPAAAPGPPDPPERTAPGRLVLAAALAVGILAVSGSAVLVRLADAPAVSLAAWRCGVGALVLAPFAFRARPALAALTAAQWRQLVASGALLAVHFALFITAIGLTTIGSATVLADTSPLFVGIGAAVFLGEPPPRRAWLGMALALAGAVAIGAGDLAGAELDTRALLGDVMAFGAALSVAGYLLLGRAARRRLPIAAYATVVYGVAALLLVVVALVFGAPLGVVGGGYDTGTWLAIAGLVIGPQLLGHTVFNALLASVPATVVAVATLAEPAGATLLGWLLLGELPGPVFWFAAPAILLGVGIVVVAKPAAPAVPPG